MSDPHDRATLTAFLAGDLDAGHNDRFEAHLLECDHCWAAVLQDRRGRALIGSLRELAPAGLAERVALTVQLADPTNRPRRTFKQPRRWLQWAALTLAAAGAAALLVIGLNGGALNGGRGRGGDPTVIDEVVHLANSAQNRDHRPISLRLNASPTPVTATQMTVAGSPVIVVRSDHPFPMPDQGVPMTSENDPWVARSGQVTLVCLNSPHPVLLAAVLPAGQLVALAYQLQQ